MSQQRIVSIGDSLAVELPGEALAGLGVQAGDKVEVRLVDKHLVIESLSEAERSRQIDEITSDLMHERGDAYRRLA